MRFKPLLISCFALFSLILLLSFPGCSKEAANDSVDSKPSDLTGEEGKMVPPP
jgi:hypothetical protein